jgi:glycosyltransferase involved in cell wall biosynthesis
MAPRVSVVLPTYNRADYLEEALESVLAQTFADFEVVVVDDGSTDDTPARLARYGERIRVIRQENRGVGAARNRGIEAARGRYVAFIDNDDLWHPRKLEVQHAFMASHPGFVGCSVPFCFSTEPGRVAFDLGVCDAGGEVRDAVRKYVEGELFLLNSAAMLDMEKLGSLRFLAEKGSIEDVPFHIRLLMRGPYGVAGRDILATYRIHPANWSRSARHLHGGIAKLRRMQAAGHFGARSDPEGHAMDVMICALARNMMMAQLAVGARRTAIASYVAEFRHQLRRGRLKFLSLYPLLVLAPSVLVTRVLRVRSTP